MPIILPYKGIYPKIDNDVFIAENAVITGDVTIGAGSSIWFGVVIRGDVMPIVIGKRTNIQDNSVIHVTRKVGATYIGSNVTVGHAVMLHACIIEDNSFIGMRSVMLDNSCVESEGMLAAGAVLTPNKKVKKHELYAGSPAKLMRMMRQSEIDFIDKSAENYVQLSREYMNIAKTKDSV